ncbi:sigma-70 domain-containing protein [[Clostridium] aminophilum]|uniref:sigma-70 domain-containing protein n=1 Tax=[Clostridium] aminophilum TaxID=1526 RepID=UPI003F9AEA1C
MSVRNENNEQTLEEFVQELAQNDDIYEPEKMTGEDFFKMYLEELKDVPKLGLEEEKEILDRIQNGTAGKSDTQRLTEGKLSAALRIARTFENQGVHINDLVQEASVAILMAAAEYEGGDFDEQMEKKIRESLEALIEEQKREKTIEEDMRARVNVLKDISAAMAKELDRAPTVPELAEKMKMTEDEIRGIMKEMLNAMSVKSAEGQADLYGGGQSPSGNQEE